MSGFSLSTPNPTATHQTLVAIAMPRVGHVNTAHDKMLELGLTIALPILAFFVAGLILWLLVKRCKRRERQQPQRNGTLQDNVREGIDAYDFATERGVTAIEVEGSQVGAGSQDSSEGLGPVELDANGDPAT